ncbi:MAG: putative membrane protein [Natrialbaceae archaeon]|jgi:uncharacterized membrane protein
MPRIVSTYHNMEDNLNDFLRQSALTGTAIVLPVLITAFVFLITIDLVSGLLNPIVIPIQVALGTTSSLVPQVISFVTLLGTILAVGAITESNVGGDRVKRGVDVTMASIPGIRSIYGPLDQISEMLLEGDTEHFQNVVMVEFPKAGMYSLAFQTAHPPDTIETAIAAEDMLTVFVPMGPNPFMGGFILHVTEEEIHEVDLSVEEGVSSIVSFGMAIEIDEHPPERPLNLSGIDGTDR